MKCTKINWEFWQNPLYPKYEQWVFNKMLIAMPERKSNCHLMRCGFLLKHIALLNFTAKWKIHFNHNGMIYFWLLHFAINSFICLCHSLFVALMKWKMALHYKCIDQMLNLNTLKNQVKTCVKILKWEPTYFL